MSEEIKNTEGTEEQVVAEVAEVVADVAQAAPAVQPVAAPKPTEAARPQARGGYQGGARGAAGGRGGQRGGPGGARGRQRGGGRGGRPGGRGGMERARPEFDQKIIDIRRVTRVVSGGRRFSFAVSVAAGDRNGRVGLGTGKAADTSLAIEKAFKSAKKKMMTLKLTKTKSIPHDIKAKFASAQIFLMPNKGRGLIAGSSARVVLNLAGVKDITAKIFSGSKNKLNNAKVAIAALSTLAYKHGEAPVKKVELATPEATESK